MKILCFLGNPGSEYTNTRHNVGFLCEDFLAQKYNFPPLLEEKKFFSLARKTTMGSHSVLTLRPQTFMNLSGKALLAAAQFYKIDISDILLVYDDIDLPFGTVRYRAEGSSGGHNGVKDCIRVFGSDSIARVKIGVASDRRLLFASTADFVLSRFSEDELIQLPSEVFPQAAQTILDWIAGEVPKK